MIKVGRALKGYTDFNGKQALDHSERSNLVIVNRQLK